MAEVLGSAETRTPQQVWPDGILPKPDAPIHAQRVGCIYHILHLAAQKTMENRYFMWPLGKGSWHNWIDSHLVALLGHIWYNTSRSKSAQYCFEQFRKLIQDEFGVTWTKSFIKPGETRWIVIWEGVRLLDERWPEVQWLASERTPSKLLGTPFQDYWMQPHFMLGDLVLGVQAKFATELADKLLLWAYHWIGAEGGRFIKRGDKLERLPPGMRLPAVADFSLELLRRIDELQANPDKYFPEMLTFARTKLDADDVST